MDAAKQRIRAATARKKEAKLVKGTEEGTSSALPSSIPKAISKVSKRKPDGDDDRLPKRTAVTPGDASSKRKSLLVTPPRRGSHPSSQAMVHTNG